MPWRRARQPTTVFLPGESHGQGSRAKGSCGAWEFMQGECSPASSDQMMAFFKSSDVNKEGKGKCYQMFLKKEVQSQGMEMIGDDV